MKTRVVVTVGLFELGDEAARKECWQATHDHLVFNVKRRTGPVTARTYDLADRGSDLRQLLTDIGGVYADPVQQAGFLEAAAAMQRPGVMVAIVEHRVAGR